MLRRRILLDACVAINLAATDNFPQIADTLHVTFVMVQEAVAEAGHFRDVTGGELVLTPINLTQFSSSEVLDIVELASSEFALYLELAAIVDDGEAATIAVAIQRNLDIATDDRRARRLCGERGLAEPLRSLALLRSYAEPARLDASRVREMLIKVQHRASFQLPRADPDLKWWNYHVVDDT